MNNLDGGIEIESKYKDLNIPIIITLIILKTVEEVDDR